MREGAVRTESHLATIFFFLSSHQSDGALLFLHWVVSPLESVECPQTRGKHSGTSFGLRALLIILVNPFVLLQRLRQ